MKVLHLTAHLGGGVGKAISGLVAQAGVSHPAVQHFVVCLEKPQKNQFIDLVQKNGGQVVVAPDHVFLEQLLIDADILQLEWWNHPATLQALALLPPLPIRLLTWSHISGLHTPIIPPSLILSSHKFLFTSPCSYQAAALKDLSAKDRDRLGVVSSSGGFADMPALSPAVAHDDLSVGYIGSLNFAKLHPRYVDFLSAVQIPDFQVRMIGDLTNQEVLSSQVALSGKPALLDFRGYTSDVAAELGQINTLAYLLNPLHYGTTENALLEAMALGIVPVVLANPAECQIVQHQVTGLIVNSPAEFAQAIHWLAAHPQERRQMGQQAASEVREKFSAEKMESGLDMAYQQVLALAKRPVDFTAILGTDPSEWFLVSQANKHIFSSEGQISPPPSGMSMYGLFELSKGTVFHFSDYFPENTLLRQWATHLRLYHPQYCL
jgi:glycosyltransferase involved in cell wall biosynthesis